MKSKSFVTFSCLILATGTYALLKNSLLKKTSTSSISVTLFFTGGYVLTNKFESFKIQLRTKFLRSPSLLINRSHILLKVP
jgi:hypothetical protein